MYENRLMFSDTGDHSVKVFNPVTRECTPHLANGKGSRYRKSAQFVQPAGLIAERRTVFIVHCSTGCLRMVSDVSPLVKHLENLRVCHHIWIATKKRILVSFTLDRAITRIQEVHNFDCQCVNQVKAFLVTTAQTQGPQGTVSTVVLEDEKRILQALKETKDLLSQHAPQILEVIKMKSLLTLICENFFSEMRAGSYDIPLQLQFDFRFSRALEEHLKQMCRTKFCYYTNAKSHYPRVKTDLRYSELPKVSPPSLA